MSITITTDVFCDVCPSWFQGPSEGRVAVQLARRQAKAAGWRRKDGEDLCPSCAMERADW